MASLRDQFEHFYALDENAKKTALQTGLVTPGTNVLLHLYRFQAVARDGKHSGLPFGLWLSLLLAGWLARHRPRASLDASAERAGFSTGSCRHWPYHWPP